LKKSNINVDLISALRTECVEHRFLYFKFFGKDVENDAENDAKTLKTYFFWVFLNLLKWSKNIR
jgi:hypothetical protein